MQGERSWWLCRLPLLEYLDMRNLPCSAASPELQSGRTAGSGSCWAPNACNSWGRSQGHIQPTILSCKENKAREDAAVCGLRLVHEVEDGHAEWDADLLAGSQGNKQAVEARGGSSVPSYRL